MKLDGMHVAVLAGEGVEDLEFWVTVMRLREEGAKVTSVGLAAGTVHGKNGLAVTVDAPAEAIDPAALDGLVLPGGWMPDKLRRYPAVISPWSGPSTRPAGRSGSSATVACWRSRPGIVAGSRATGSLGIKDDLENAGATWVDAPPSATATSSGAGSWRTSPPSAASWSRPWWSRARAAQPEADRAAHPRPRRRRVHRGALRRQPGGRLPARRWLPDAILAAIAREMNLSETGLPRRGRADVFELRWFTPAVEVPLCGHATLASAHVLWEEERRPGRPAHPFPHPPERGAPGRPGSRWADRPRPAARPGGGRGRRRRAPKPRSVPARWPSVGPPGRTCSSSWRRPRRSAGSPRTSAGSRASRTG